MAQQPTDELRPEDAELTADLRSRVRFNDAGLVPAIVQAAGTGEVLSLIHISEPTRPY